MKITSLIFFLVGVFLLGFDDYEVLYKALGALFLLLSILTSLFIKRKIKYKVLLIISYIVLAIPLALVSNKIDNHILNPLFNQKVEFVFNKEFEGEVLIVFPVEEGIPVKYNNDGVESIKIPSNGILFYQGYLKQRTTNWSFKIEGDKNQIEVLKPFHKLEITETNKTFIVPSDKNYYSYLLGTYGDDYIGRQIVVSKNQATDINPNIFSDHRNFILDSLAILKIGTETSTGKT